MLEGVEKGKRINPLIIYTAGQVVEEGGERTPFSYLAQTHDSSRYIHSFNIIYSIHFRLHHHLFIIIIYLVLRLTAPTHQAGTEKWVPFAMFIVN